ncbi:MAG TPA: hypothetical protein PLD10_04865 [Rhodopila sp.]|nr:hypothetical protein [Rhodopila sp.]
MKQLLPPADHGPPKLGLFMISYRYRLSRLGVWHRRRRQIDVDINQNVADTVQRRTPFSIPLRIFSISGCNHGSVNIGKLSVRPVKIANSGRLV